MMVLFLGYVYGLLVVAVEKGSGRCYIFFKMNQYSLNRVLVWLSETSDSKLDRRSFLKTCHRELTDSELPAST